MPGESPLSMMRPAAPQTRRAPAKSAPSLRLWPVLAVPLGLMVLAGLWVVLWYYAAGVAERTIAAWMEREAAAGRAYSCASQAISGFPFRFETQCRDAVADLKGNQPPFSVTAKNVLIATQVYQPTLLTGDLTGPLTFAEPGRPPSFIADWSRAQARISGLPPFPARASITFDRPRIDRGTGNAGAGAGARGATIFEADHADLQAHIIEGSASNRPVIEAVLHLATASAPGLHPLAAQPTDGELDLIVRGLSDLAPKPWAERFRELQAAGGKIEIKLLRVAQADSIIMGAGVLKVNANGKLDGLLSIAIVDIEHIVPLLGVDQMIGAGINQLTGAKGTPTQGLGTLDRLIPGLSNVVRQGAAAGLIENLKKMGQPTEIDKKPATLLPLRISDGAIYLGMLPLGTVPPLF